MWLLILASTLTMSDARSEIKDDEVVVFYPTYARQVNDGRAWKVPIHGSIFEAEENSLKREVILGLLRRVFGLTREDSQTEIFKKRARAFLVDNEGGKDIAIRLGDKTYPAGTSRSNGHFFTTLLLPAADVNRLRLADPDNRQWLTFQAVTRPGDNRAFVGQLQLIGPQGLSVISDIDDTIKVSRVTDRRALLRNTFLREFKALKGMSQRYRKWADAGIAFHYLSGSPWQLYGPLSEFFREEGFPRGSFHLKQFRLKDRSALELLGSQEKYKSGVIEQILADFPSRRFILAGDSGEQDPEIYGAAAREHPDQVILILIRDVDGPSGEDARFRTAFDGVSSERWRVFRDAGELDAITPSHLIRPGEVPQE